MLRLDLADRRRLGVASAITVIALPSLWLMSRNDQTGAPNVATAGVAVEAEHSAAPAPGASPAPIDAMGAPGAAYLDGLPRTPPAAVIAIATRADPVDSYREVGATFSSELPGSTCLVNAAPFGKTVTVTNLDNSRTVTCVATSSPLIGPDEVVLPTAAFQEIADLTDAPVPVHVSW